MHFSIIMNIIRLKKLSQRAIGLKNIVQKREREKKEKEKKKRNYL